MWRQDICLINPGPMNSLCLSLPPVTVPYIYVIELGIVLFAMPYQNMNPMCDCVQPEQQQFCIQLLGDHMVWVGLIPWWARNLTVE